MKRNQSILITVIALLTALAIFGCEGQEASNTKIVAPSSSRNLPETGPQATTKTYPQAPEQTTSAYQSPTATEQLPETKVIEKDQLSQETITPPVETKTEPAEIEKQPEVAVMQEVTEPKTEETKPVEIAQAEGPRIHFDTNLKDFGKVGPGAENETTFKFKNVGNQTLTLKKPQASCGCTIPRLTKMQYEPGEQGEITVQFKAPKARGTTSKNIYVPSNDKNNPKYQLTVKATTVLQIDVEPDKLNLSLDKPNAGAKPIKIYSVDDTPFSITAVNSTGNAITAEFDPDKKAVEHIINPIVDIEKLTDRTGVTKRSFGYQHNLRGIITIKLTHPHTDQIMVQYETPAKYSVTPPAIIDMNPDMEQGVIRELWVTSNYQDKVNIESITSDSGTIEVIEKEAAGNRYRIKIRIMPPEELRDGKSRKYSDTLYIKLKDADPLTIPCNLWLPRTSAKN